MTATEIYNHFRVNKGLREHMIRVAAVAKFIADRANGKFNTDLVVKAALVHDLGNIVKIKFDSASELFEPEGFEYYQKIQAEVMAKYGNKDHDVTLAMMREIEISENVISISQATVLVDSANVESSGTIDQKLMQYADMRVQIDGIVSLQERYDELTARTVPHRYSHEIMSASRVALEKIEDTLFNELPIVPTDVTDESTADIQTELFDFQVI